MTLLRVPTRRKDVKNLYCDRFERLAFAISNAFSWSAAQQPEYLVRLDGNLL